MEKAIAAVVAHEIGHTLGLRHNFKGTLLPPSSSVMDYTSDHVAATAAIPGSYDVEAIRYLYGLSTAPPSQPFCTDGDVGRDPRCEVFDEGTDPLREFWGPFYAYYAQVYLQTGDPDVRSLVELLMNVLVGFVSNAGTPADRQAALDFLLGDLRVPASADGLAQFPATYASGVDQLSRVAFSKLVHDPALPRPPLLSGAPRPAPRPLDQAGIASLVGELRGNLLNLDGIRSFANRRQCVDVLKRMQVLPAYDLLREARQTLSTPAEPVPVDPAGPARRPHRPDRGGRQSVLRALAGGVRCTPDRTQRRHGLWLSAARGTMAAQARWPVKRPELGCALVMTAAVMGAATLVVSRSATGADPALPAGLTLAGHLAEDPLGRSQAAFPDSLAPLSHPTDDSPAVPDLQTLRERIARLVELEGGMGVAVALVDRSGRRWAEGFGAPRARARPWTRDTLFRVGSLTKPFVALAIMRLCEQGRLRLTDRVRDLAPEIAVDNRWERTHPLQVAHLLEHTAGFDEMRFNEIFDPDASQDRPLREVLAVNPRSRVVRWPPGTRFAYSQPGYTLAAYLIEKASGRPYERFLQDEVFAPLGISGASLRLSPEVRKRLAVGHQRGQPAVQVNLLHRPAGNLMISASGLGRFLSLMIARDWRPMASVSSGRPPSNGSNDAGPWGWRRLPSVTVWATGATSRARCPCVATAASFPGTGRSSGTRPSTRSATW